MSSTQKTRFTVFLTAQEESVLRHLAAKDGRSLSSFIRRAVVNSLQEQHTPQVHTATPLHQPTAPQRSVTAYATPTPQRVVPQTNEPTKPYEPPWYGAGPRPTQPLAPSRWQTVQAPPGAELTAQQRKNLPMSDPRRIPMTEEDIEALQNQSAQLHDVIEPPKEGDTHYSNGAPMYDAEGWLLNPDGSPANESDD